MKEESHATVPRPPLERASPVRNTVQEEERAPRAPHCIGQSAKATAGLGRKPPGSPRLPAQVPAESPAEVALVLHWLIVPF